MKHFPDGNADIEVIIQNSRPSKSCVCSGYRPAFKVKEDYLTTGIIRLIDCEELEYGKKLLLRFGLLLLNFILIVWK